LTGDPDRNADVAALEALLDHKFADQALLLEALTHSSANTNLGPGKSYERLEFLGDRVLGLILAEYYFTECAEGDQGDLSLRLHAAARQSALAGVARDLNIARYIKVQSGMDAALNDGVLSDVMESLIAALYIDAGLEAARRLVKTHWPLDRGSVTNGDKDAKSLLQEFAMQRGGEVQGENALPKYRLVEKTGPDHAPRMIFAVHLEGYPEQQASGGSRKQAEQRAAALLLALISGAET
jgi:ribonuclease-3